MVFLLFTRQALYGALLFISTLAQAQVFSNNITGSVTGNPYTTGQVVAAHLSVSGIGHGSSVTTVTDMNQYTASGWPPFLGTNAYFTFTLNPNTGYRINFSSFTFNSSIGFGGPIGFTVRSSKDGFTGDLGVALLSTSPEREDTILVQNPFEA